MTAISTERRTRLLVGWLTLFIAFMFVFAFALVPLYDKLCQALGITGRVDEAFAEQIVADKSGLLPLNTPGGTVNAAAMAPMNLELIVTKDNGLLWDFSTPQRVVEVIPGEQYRIDFFATNRSNEQQTIQAIANVTPTELASYLLKMECFCFQEQTLAAGESAVLPLVVTISPDVPEHYSTLTLSYSLYLR